MARPLLYLILSVPLAIMMLPGIWSNPSVVQESSSRAIDTIIPLTDSVASVRPVLTAKDPESGKVLPLRISKVKVDVRVIGNRATTTLDMEFINETNRILEGQFVFPLGEQQTISRFALDVNGSLREGVVVEKNKGQEVYETTIRKGIDPGLLEHVQGNSYKARVYPIPANGSKRLLIAYEQELAYTGREWMYLLPLGFTDLLDKFDLRAEVVQQEVKPKESHNELATLQFEKWNESFIAEIHKEKFKADKQIGFVVPVPENRPQVFTSKVNGENYFYAVAHPQVVGNAKKKSNHLLLLWDASSSGQDRNTAKEMELLDAYFKHSGDLIVYPVLFAHEILSDKMQFKVTNGEWSALREYLSQTHYDGATSLGAIDLKRYTVGPLKPDEALLFTDGMSNFGPGEMLLGEYPVSTITSNTAADFNVLKRISYSTGGCFINLNTETKEQAFEKLKNQDFRMIRADYDALGITEISPTIANVSGNVYAVAGKYNGKANNLLLSFGAGYQVSSTIPIRIPEVETNSDPAVKHLWAWKKFEEMELINPDDESTNAAFAKEHSLVTRYTSLIVLDALEDYIEHKIIPPAEMQKDYWAAIESEVKAEKAAYKDQLERVVDMVNARYEWWKKDFTAQQTKIRDKKSASGTGSYHGSNNVTADSLRVNEEALMERHVAGNVGTYSMTVTNANGAVASEMELDALAKSDVKEKEAISEGTDRGKMELKEWNPDVPYLSELKKTEQASLYKKYLELKKEYRNTPSFYLDVSDHFLKAGLKSEALRILSNVAELEAMNYQLMRILAHRLLQLGYTDLSILMFREVLKIRTEEPQSYRDLALALERKGEYQEAIGLLYKIAEKSWDGRFPEIELIAIEEINAMIGRTGKQFDLSFVDDRLEKQMPCDVRVVVTWDTDNCDMDLWVTDPSGETCKYDHKETSAGGMISSDFTGGYGPEEFLIKKAMKGKYKVQVNYYGTREQTLTGPTTIQVKMITGYGTPKEKIQEVTRRLSTSKEVLEIGSFEF